jgi:TRAP transporter 4TM/12TM fusion protein
MRQGRKAVSHSAEHAESVEGGVAGSGSTGSRAFFGLAWQRYVVGFIAICWSLFQLSAASFLLLDSLTLRAIHLGFALLLVFCAFPLRRSTTKEQSGSTGSHRFGALDAGCALVACVAALYVVLDYQGISERQGLPLGRDLVVGVVLVVLLLEAARRVVGLALPILCGFFALYAMYGNYMPDFLAFKGVSLNRLLGQMTMSTEGIYGIPLDVSASIVFLFVLFGAMLEKAGAGEYFIRLALSLLGRFRGGPAKAAVLGSGLTGMVSGSSIANVVTTGTFTIPLMKRVGYPATKAAAIEVAAGIDGQIMPPVMGAAAFIMAEYLNVPYFTVVKAAVIPAVLSYCGLFYITHVEACKLGMTGMAREEVPRFRDVLLSGFHYLLPMAVLIVELVWFRHSPQLSVLRAIVVLAAIIVAQHAAHALRAGKTIQAGLTEAGRVLVESLASGGKNMVSVAVATACAGIIVGVVTLGLGGLITEFIDQVSGGNIYLMLVVTAVACLIVGMGIPTTATYIVVASLTAPALVLIAGNHGFVMPLIAAHLFCFYFGILADDTPPVGLASFAAAAIAGSEPISTSLQGFRYHIRTAILPFAFVFNHELLLIGVDSVFHGLVVLVTGCIGVLAFVSATQGWFATRNRWYESVLLLVVTVCMLRPGMMASSLPISSRYVALGIGTALYVGLYFWQRARRVDAQNDKLMVHP